MTTNHRIQHNFKISPKGPIWNKICELFSVDKSKCVSAISIYNESTNPENTWDGHYEYAVYRPDDAWRGKALNKSKFSQLLTLTNFQNIIIFLSKRQRNLSITSGIISKISHCDYQLQTFSCLQKMYNMYMKITPVY